MKLDHHRVRRRRAIPGEFAFGVDRSRRRTSSCRPTAIPISRGATSPPGTRSLALAVPRPRRAVARRRREQGRPRRPGVAAARRFLPLGADRSAARPPRHRARRILGRRRRARQGRAAGARGARQGINDYTGWFAGDADMAGNYFGYDGPCPPWNDETRPSLHLHALRARRDRAAASTGEFTGAEARNGDAAATCWRRRPSPAATR